MPVVNKIIYSWHIARVSIKHIYTQLVITQIQQIKTEGSGKLIIRMLALTIKDKPVYPLPHKYERYRSILEILSTSSYMLFDIKRAYKNAEHVKRDFKHLTYFHGYTVSFYEKTKKDYTKYADGY